ncbi:MAG TPA: VCBS repeat-containing protein, partial [Nannocystis sp.]
LRKGVDINNGISTIAFCNAGSEYGGGPPTVADFDGDGIPDVGAAGAVGYIVFSGAKMMDPNVPNEDIDLWFKTTHDCSSAVTGSSVFDFNGDGKAEVIYSDEYHLWMYDGPTGTNLIPSTCNTTGTLWEYPLVADVDNDGQADIVVASNAYGVTCPDNGTKQSGIRIFGSASGSWVRTRRIWNQHTYHITNVREDGTIPAVEPANWTTPGLNNYRQNVQPEGEFSAPDLTATIYPRCEGPYGLVARVRNIGQAAVPPGVVVGFYEGDPDQGGVQLGVGMTKKALYPAEAEDVAIDVPNPSEALTDGTIPVFVVLDDGQPEHSWKECRTENNKVQGSGYCIMPG